MLNINNPFGLINLDCWKNILYFLNYDTYLEILCLSKIFYKKFSPKSCKLYLSKYNEFIFKTNSNTNIQLCFIKHRIKNFINLRKLVCNIKLNQNNIQLFRNIEYLDCKFEKDLDLNELKYLKYIKNVTSDIKLEKCPIIKMKYVDHYLNNFKFPKSIKYLNVRCLELDRIETYKKFYLRTKNFQIETLNIYSAKFKLSYLQKLETLIVDSIYTKYIGILENVKCLTVNFKIEYDYENIENDYDYKSFKRFPNLEKLVLNSYVKDGNINLLKCKNLKCLILNTSSTYYSPQTVKIHNFSKILILNNYYLKYFELIKPKIVKMNKYSMFRNKYTKILFTDILEYKHLIWFPNLIKIYCLKISNDNRINTENIQINVVIKLDVKFKKLYSKINL